ncbi:MAG: DUF5615 family PIN-like protein [Cyclobacteriaceae bacterium]
MKVMLDSCVWGGAGKVLQTAGYDVIWIGDFLKDPGDEAIITLAFEQDRVLITLDKDSGELAVVKGMPHHGIVRLVDHAGREQGPVCVQVLHKYRDDLVKGALITVDKQKVSVRKEKS